MGIKLKISADKKWIELRPIIIMAIVLFVLPFIVPSQMMAAEILIMAIPTLAFILLLGFLGQLHFGMGSLFAVGAYTTAILMTRYHFPLVPALVAGVIFTGIISAVMGYFCNKQGGMIFALLTLAFNQLIWFIIWQWKSFTGGADGIVGIDRSTLNLALFSLNLRPIFNFYIFVLIFFILTFFAMERLIKSPFGKVLQSLRESELRAKTIGYNPMLYRWIAFIITGMVCGLGGALFALHQEYVGEQLAHWSTGTQIAIMALLGGTFVMYGAIIGAGVFIFLSDWMNKFAILAKTGGALFTLGIVFVLVVMFFEGGLYSGIEALYIRLKEKARLLR